MKLQIKPILLIILLSQWMVACVPPPKKDTPAANKLKNTAAESRNSEEGQDADAKNLIISEQDNTLLQITEHRPEGSSITNNQTGQKSLVLSFRTPLSSTIEESTKKIAIMLPLTGKYKSLGLEIQQGVIREYFNVTIKPKKISFYDSNTKRVNELYQKLSKEYTTIIGPLLVNKIEQINYSTQITNIILNKKNNPSSNTYTFNFKEYSQDEIKQIVQFLKTKKHHSVLLITNNNLSGSIFSDELSKQWFSEGKVIKKIIYLTDDLTKNATKIKTTLSQKQPMKSITSRTGESDIFTKNVKDDFPFIRQDIDAIVISLEAKNSRLINPLTTAIGGQKIPIYASSILAKSSNFNTKKDRSLRQIYFLDSVWKYDSQNNGFLNSLARDALRIALTIDRDPRIIYQGLTGTYFINSGKMNRQQNWYQFRRNKVTLVKRLVN